jgi:hypothetical protein
MAPEHARARPRLSSRHRTSSLIQSACARRVCSA